MFAIIFARQIPTSFSSYVDSGLSFPLNIAKYLAAISFLALGGLLWILVEVESYDEIERFSDYFSRLSSPRKMKQRVEGERLIF